MIGSRTKHPNLLARSIYAMAWVIAGLAGGLGCGQDVPGPSGAAGSGTILINDVLQVVHAYSGGELCFAICYDRKLVEGAGTTPPRKVDGPVEIKAFLVAKGGARLDLKYVNNQTAIDINGKKYPPAAGRIFHCRLESGKLLVDQFLVAPELMKGDWPNEERMKKVLDSIPELREILRKGKSD
jgi:hypothetical protein